MSCKETDFQRIYMAMAIHDPRPAPTLVEMSSEDALSWGIHQMQKFPGGPGAYALDQANRQYLLALVVDSRQMDMIDDSHFSAILAEISTIQGRARVLQALRVTLSARQLTHGLMDKLSYGASAPLPAYASGAQERARFLNAQPGGPGVLYRDFMARKDVQHEMPTLVRNYQVYEFSWGFVTEDYGVWNFYVADVWRDGTRKYYDRFIAAWNQLAESKLAQAITRAERKFYISFDDGSSAYCCISISCVLDSRRQALAREWVAGEFLEQIWPQMVQQTMAPPHALECV
jgi:hypothetical protein